MSEQNESDISTKEFFIKYGICAGFFVVFLFVTIYTTKVAHKAWNNNLKFSVEKCLEENQSGVWSVGSSLEIQNPYSTSIACYEAINNETEERFYSVIARIMTYYGPMNFVFLCSGEGEVSVVGCSSVHGRVLRQVNDTRVSARVKYFMERIPVIIGRDAWGKNE